LWFNAEKVKYWKVKSIEERKKASPTNCTLDLLDEDLTLGFETDKALAASQSRQLGGKTCEPSSTLLNAPDSF